MKRIITYGKTGIRCGVSSATAVCYSCSIYLKIIDLYKILTAIPFIHYLVLSESMVKKTEIISVH